MKRKSDDLYESILNTNVKRKKEELTDTDWISGTVVKNYMLDEPVLDWFNMYYDKKNNILKNNSKSFDKNILGNPFLQKGLIFERQIYEDLKNKFPNDCRELYNQYIDGEINEENFNKTKKAIQDNVPIIMQAVLMEKNLKFRGVADLIVRTDYLNKIFRNKISLDFDSERLPKNIKKKKSYYVVIDIKYSHLTLCTKDNLIRNTGRMKAYKSQLLIYNMILGSIQSWYPSKAYIMGKSWNIDSKVDPDRGFDCYDLLGVINFETFDRMYINKTNLAIDWVRKLRKDGHKWSPLQPTIKEMCCNLSNNDDEPWSELKKQIVEKTKDLTCIWNIGKKLRDEAFDKNIRRYDQPECTVENLGLNPTNKKTEIIRQILKINSSSEKQNILPKKIKTKKYKWYKTYLNEFYIDFETFCDMPDDVNHTSSKHNGIYLFMIGVGFEKNGNWIYKCFKCRDKTLLEERRIIKKFKKYINLNKIESKKPTRLVHWSPAEKSILEKVLDRHKKLLKMWWDDILWTDLCDLFKSEPIVVKGATNFKLKTIARAMYSHKMIRTRYNDDGITNGMMASLSAQNYYKNLNLNNLNKLNNLNNLNEIISYNEIDCKVLWDILKFLRKNKR
jgi:hypothetical protein